MSKIDKLIERLLSKPKDFTWDELVKVLAHFGYNELKGGGARRKFADDAKHVIMLHKPHPQNTLKRYALEEVIANLKERGKILDE